jgi:hypothetical protein
MSKLIISTESLPSGIRTALLAVGFKSREVAIEAREQTTISSCGGKGTRGYAIVLPDHSVCPMGRALVQYGSWGGPNPFERGNPIDDLRAAPTPIPVGSAIITGTAGDRVSATVHLHPIDYLKITAPASADLMVATDAHMEGRDATATEIAIDAINEPKPDPLTLDERRVLYAFGGLKGGEYRREHLAKIADGSATYGRKMPPVDVPAIVASLTERGYLKFAKNGAGQITTLGKNARSGRAGCGEVW